MAHANRGQRDGEGKTNRTSDLDTRYLSGTLEGGDEFRWSVAAVGDHDANGSVRAFDLLSLLVSWGPCKGCPGDFDGNGIVGASDLLALLVHWGPCP